MLKFVRKVKIVGDDGRKGPPPMFRAPNYCLEECEVFSLILILDWTDGIGSFQASIRISGNIW